MECASKWMSVVRMRGLLGAGAGAGGGLGSAAAAVATEVALPVRRPLV